MAAVIILHNRAAATGQWPAGSQGAERQPLPCRRNSDSDSKQRRQRPRRHRIDHLRRLIDSGSYPLALHLLAETMLRDNALDLPPPVATEPRFLRLIKK